MRKFEMLKALIDYYSEGNQSKFARLLGVQPQTIGSWKDRDTLNAELIYAKCENISPAWLLSGGEGDMIAAPTTMTDEMEHELIRLRAENDVLREVIGLSKKGIKANVG